MKHRITTTVTTQWPIVITAEPEGGYSVVCPTLNVSSQGETIEAAREAITEAVELYVSGVLDSVEPMPLTIEDVRPEQIREVEASADIDASIAPPSPGPEAYTWETSRDERLRPSHADMLDVDQ